MSFYQQLIEQTQAEREYLLSAPLIQRCLKQQSFTLAEYQAFLTEAYHHVKHTVPLLMAVGSRLSSAQEYYREAIAEYIEEELGHQEWVLNDLAATGADKEQVRHGTPRLATELMVAYAYDTVLRGNPLAFFGMVLQLPLIFLTDPFLKMKGQNWKLLGNLIFWVSFCIFGQPVAALAYFFAWQAKYGGDTKPAWPSAVVFAET